MWLKITSKALVFGVLCTFVLSWIAISSPQRASADPFTCETGFYQMIGGQLTELDSDTGTYTPIGAAGSASTNAVGYNVEDNYIYAIRNDDGFYGNLLRIHSDGSIDNLGVPTGLPIDTVYIAGDFDESGNLYVRKITNTNEIRVIDVSAGTSSLLTLSAPIFASELVYIDGYLYGMRGVDTLYQVNVATGDVVTRSVGGLPDDMASLEAFGAGWATADGVLYLARNATGVIYRIDDYMTANPTATPVLVGTITSSNDGASCLNAASVIDDLMAHDDTYETTTGEGLNVEAGAGLLTNDTGASITVTDFSQPSHGSVSVNANGSLTYTPDNDFSGTDTFTYTITDTFGATSTATVTITVTDATVTGNGSDSDILANTGQSITIAIMAAVGLLTIGSLALMKRRFN